MKITKTCIYTNHKNSMEIDITEDQYQQFKQGGDIDETMPSITYEEREFLLTGALPGDEDSLYEEDEQNHQKEPGWEWY